MILLCLTLISIHRNQNERQYQRDIVYAISPPVVLPPKYLRKGRDKSYKCINKTKWSHTRVAYYSNTIATKQIMLVCGDVESNPGWETNASQINSKDYLQNFAEGVSYCKNNMNIAHVNIRSLRNKADVVKLLMKICRFDILALTETHLDSSISN